MLRVIRMLSLCCLAALVPATAGAGWVIDWSTTAVNQNGERMAVQRATQAIAGNRVRMQQPEVITVIDYGRDQYTLMNVKKQYFWSGSIDDYLREMGQHRQTAMRERVAAMGMAEKMSKKNAEKNAGNRATDQKTKTIGPGDLPPVSITSAGTQEKIAGYDAEKYDVKVDGELFQELWLAHGLDLSADLDAARYQAIQEKTGSAMMGKSSKQYNALYRDPQYRALVAKAFVLKSVTHHLAGGYERIATAVRQEDVPASTFEVPDSFRKVRLADLFDPPPTPAPRPTGNPTS